MRAELKTLSSADTGVNPDSPTFLIDLERWVPEDSELFDIVVTAEIGSAGEPGADLFYVHVCSRDWFAEQRLEKGFSCGHAYLFLRRWDYGVLRRAAEDICRHTAGDEWSEVAHKLSHFPNWEFADYEAVK